MRTLAAFLAVALPLAARAQTPPTVPASPTTTAPPTTPSTLPSLPTPPIPSLPALWAAFKTPTANPPRSIGGYSAGCIDGAVALPKVGEGFRVAKPERNRVFGHPLLVGLIRDLGARLVALHAAPLSVGDLGQPRGGPAPTGHASHQTGLDVDLWFLPPVAGSAVSMVDKVRMLPSPKFNAAVTRLLLLTAADPRVERIFVNPVLKRALCERPPAAAGADRGWLRKLRPWWGHDDHFHVRLACPPDSPACTAQAPLPPGDGCSELAWWFDKKAQADREKGHQSYAAKVGAAPPLPAGCQSMLDGVAATPASAPTSAK